ncbi:MAG: nuclear transport factor 2 family protein [Asticcacaulis sp.]
MQEYDLDAILGELAAREPIFHQRAFGTRREDLLKMTAEDFWEIGASGNVYTRDFVIETVLERYKTPEPYGWSCSSFSIRPLAEDLYLLSYVLEQPERRTRRTTLWRKKDEAWQIVFHQGTVMAADQS